MPHSRAASPSIMPASVAMPAVRQNRSKLAPTCCQASSTIAAGTTPAGVVDSFMALLSFVDSAPRAYRLKAGNAYLTFSTSTRTSPQKELYGQEPKPAHSVIGRCIGCQYLQAPCARP